MATKIKKLWLFIKTKFLTKKFLIFGLIGVINTGIHLLVYNLGYLTFALGPFLSNTLAFITASVFSYFANAIFTFKPTSRNTMQFSAVMVVYLARLLTSNLLTWGFDFGIQNWLGVDYLMHPWAVNIAPFLASALLIPLAYFALEYVFKATDKETIV